MSSKWSWFSGFFQRGEAAAPSAWTSGQVILDDYVVEEELGKGGMGAVYLVRSRSSGPHFALKRKLLHGESS